MRPPVGKYIGIVIDRVFLTEKEQGQPYNLARDQFEMHSMQHMGMTNIKLIEDRPRIFTDEVRMCYGVPALAQMDRCFAKSNYAGWRAWKALV